MKINKKITVKICKEYFQKYMKYEIGVMYLKKYNPFT